MVFELSFFLKKYKKEKKNLFRRGFSHFFAVSVPCGAVFFLYVCSVGEFGVERRVLGVRLYRLAAVQVVQH